MGVLAAAAAGGGMLAGGILSGVAGQKEKKAAYMASQVESARKNFLASLDNDKKNLWQLDETLCVVLIIVKLNRQPLKTTVNSFTDLTKLFGLEQKH